MEIVAAVIYCYYYSVYFCNCAATVNGLNSSRGFHSTLSSLAVCLFNSPRERTARRHHDPPQHKGRIVYDDDDDDDKGYTFTL